jgi:hypothetical protein
MDALGKRVLHFGIYNTWHYNGLPGVEFAARFLPHWDDYIYVQSHSGRFYAQSLNPKLDDNWFEVHPTMVGELGVEGDRDCGEITQPWTPALPSGGLVEQGLECGYWTQSGGFIKYSFAILENGEIWRWRSR